MHNILYVLYGIVSIFILYLFYKMEWKRYFILKKKYVKTTADLVKVTDDGDTEQRNFILTLSFTTIDGNKIENEYYEKPAIPFIKNKYQTEEQYFQANTQFPILYNPDHPEYYIIEKDIEAVNKRMVKMSTIALALIIGLFLYGTILLHYISWH